MMKILLMVHSSPFGLHGEVVGEGRGEERQSKHSAFDLG